MTISGINAIRGPVEYNISTRAKNKFRPMMKLDQDGSGSFSRTESAGVSLKVFSDGRMHLSGICSSQSPVPGIMLGGSSFVVSKFAEDKPVDTVLLFHERGLRRKATSVGIGISENDVPVDVWSEALSDVLRGSEVDRIGPNLVEIMMRNKAEPAKWADLIPLRYMLGSVDIVGELLLGMEGQCLLGVIGDSRVLLSRLSDTPPLGSVELIPGVAAKQTEVWLRRLERMLALTDYPPCVLRPVGFVELEPDEFYFVSLFPEDLQTEEIVPKPFRDSNFDNVIELIEQVSNIVKFCHSNGITFNGTLNYNAFLFHQDGRCWLNSGYIISRVFDSQQLYGSATPDEIQFFSPERMCNLSAQITMAITYLEGAAPQSLSPIKDDLCSLGLFILSLQSQSGIPYPWLSPSQYTLCSMIASSMIDCDVPWLSFAYKPSVRVGAKTAKMACEDNLSPHEKLAAKLIRGELSIDDILVSLQRYKEWQDRVMNETSVETEVKAVFSKFYSIIHVNRTEFV